MKSSKNYSKLLKISFLALACLIFIYVIFIPFTVGVSDQGDFDRIMGPTGLSLLDSDKNNPEFVRFYKYIITGYKINPISNVFNSIGGSSIGALITLVCTICRLLGQNVFKTQYLAITYFIIYLCAITLILKCLNIKNLWNYIIIGALTLFIFFDGNYLVWFNSLYGEPMMISSLMLFICSVLYYAYHKYSLKRNDKILSKIVFIFISALLFVGSKLQVTLCLPFILLLIGKIIYDNKSHLSKLGLGICGILFISLIAYPAVITMNSGSLSKDTQYNSVFYGVLNGSETPEQDLIDMGLNPDMAVEAGKHSYLSKDEYVKYTPHTEITEKEFYSKISNRKLAKFYLTHPKRLIEGMKYTASKAFYTSTSLGKAERNYSEEPVTELKRFTTWSFLRENYMPHNLLFIIAIYVLVFGYSVINLIKNRTDKGLHIKTYLLWILILISGLQFPMPFVGNGHADTAKQLFLFNFIFDIFLFLIIITFVLKLSILVKRFKSKK